MDELPASHPTVEESLGQGLCIGAAKKIEVTSAMRLFDALLVEFAVATFMSACRRTPCFTSTSKLLCVNAKVQSSRVNVELDDVPISHERERPANRRLGRNM